MCEDADAAAALGVNTTRYKVIVFTITTALAAAGAVQAHYVQIMTIEDALNLRGRAVRLPARRDDAFKKAKRETGRGQGSLDL